MSAFCFIHKLTPHQRLIVSGSVAQCLEATQLSTAQLSSNQSTEPVNEPDTLALNTISSRVGSIVNTTTQPIHYFLKDPE